MGADGPALPVRKNAESMWLAMEWVCDEKTTAVINSLKKVKK